MNLSSAGFSAGGGAFAASVSSLGETSVCFALAPDGPSSGSVGSATSPPRFCVVGPAFAAASRSFASRAAFAAFSFSAFSAAALLIACALRILSSSAPLSSGPITLSSHCSVLPMPVLSSSPFFFAAFAFGSAA